MVKSIESQLQDFFFSWPVNVLPQHASVGGDLS